MWPWGISSSRGVRGAAVVAALLCLFSASPASSKVFLTLGEALELAFPGCDIDRRTVYLTREQLEKARELADAPVERAIVHPYVATCDDKPGGVAYFDAHRVRTLPETLMVAVDAQDRVRRIEVLSFREPEDYLPGERWYAQFLDKELTESLQLKGEIRGITGATLTARATTDAVRRLLAFHAVIFPRESQEEEPQP